MLSNAWTINKSWPVLFLFHEMFAGKLLHYNRLAECNMVGRFFLPEMISFIVEFTVKPSISFYRKGHSPIFLCTLLCIGLSVSNWHILILSFSHILMDTSDKKCHDKSHWHLLTLSSSPWQKDKEASLTIFETL